MSIQQINKQPKFNNIGLEYAKRYEEIEKARDIFNEERGEILAELARVINLGLKEHGVKAKESYKKGNKRKFATDVSIWKWEIDRKYSIAWNKCHEKKEKKLSGILIEFDSGEDQPFGFYISIWFKDKKFFISKRDGKVEDEDEILHGLVKMGLSELKILPDSSITYFVVSSISPKDNENFLFSRFVEEVSKTTELFKKIDEYYAEFYNKKYQEEKG